MHFHVRHKVLQPIIVLAHVLVHHHNTSQPWTNMTFVEVCIVQRENTSEPVLSFLDFQLLCSSTSQFFYNHVGMKNRKKFDSLLYTTKFWDASHKLLVQWATLSSLDVYVDKSRVSLLKDTVSGIVQWCKAEYCIESYKVSQCGHDSGGEWTCKRCEIWSANKVNGVYV